jgi:hypothetical protein
LYLLHCVFRALGRSCRGPGIEFPKSAVVMPFYRYR